MKRPVTIVLAAALAFAGAADLLVRVVAQRSGVTLSGHALIAVTIGAFLTALVGGGLLALSFYSARAGHDDAARNARAIGAHRRGDP